MESSELKEKCGSKAEKATYWKQIFDDWEKSGLTQKIYCQLNNLVYTQFLRWRIELRKNPPKLIPIEPTIKTKTENTSVWIITLNSKLSLHIKSNFTEENLLQLIKSMGVSLC